MNIMYICINKENPYQNQNGKKIAFLSVWTQSVCEKYIKSTCLWKNENQVRIKTNLLFYFQLTLRHEGEKYEMPSP